MITLQQCKHVISLILKQMCPGCSQEFQNSHNRDLIFFNKLRGELCGNIISNPKLKSILLYIHNAVRIEQINSVPLNQKCAITERALPTYTSGISLVIFSCKKQITHICIEKKYQTICFGYFKIRNFPFIIETRIKEWLNSQLWYIPHTYSLTYLNNKILDSNLPVKIFNEFMHACEAVQ